MLSLYIFLLPFFIFEFAILQIINCIIGPCIIPVIIYVRLYLQMFVAGLMSFLPLNCRSFYLRLLMTPLVSSYLSYCYYAMYTGIQVAISTHKFATSQLLRTFYICIIMRCIGQGPIIANLHVTRKRTRIFGPFLQTTIINGDKVDSKILHLYLG